jgi:DNA polymerase (family 10)
MPVENTEIARVFREVADLLEVEGANPFRVRAYRTAARTAETHTGSLDRLAHHDGGQLAKLPGIGVDLAGKIEEIVRTGSLGLLRELRHEAPRGAVELLAVPGIGPKRAATLVEALGVRSLAGLARAARAHRICEIPGFGERTERHVLHEIEANRAVERRMLRARAAQYGEALLAHLRAVDGVEHVELVGSYRRCRETVGDLDVLVACGARVPVIERFATYGEVSEVLARGPTKASVRLRCGLQVDLRVVREASYGAALHYFTGSKAHNIAVRTLGKQRGLKINEYGVFRNKRCIGGREENDVFDAVGLPPIPPELREDRGEIAAAAAGQLPRLVALGQLRGDLHAHTTDSDGRDTLEAMADAAVALGHEYLAITDHTPAVRVAGGLDRAGFRRQWKRIDRLNASLAARRTGLTLLKGAEVDIHPDGTLDLDDDTLAVLDIVVVALHSKLTLSTAEQTRRLVRALSRPSVDVLAHPSGRLLAADHARGRRGATFDLDEVCHVAAEQGVLLEIDGQPDRLDLDDVACRAALERHVKITVDSDAHSVAELHNLRWGVDQARRGWATAPRVANTRPLAKLLALLHQARR